MIEAILHGVGAYQSGSVIGPARWPHFDLIIVTRGSVEFTVAGKSQSCEAGSSICIPPGFPFAGTAGRSGSEIWVQHFRQRREAGRGKPRPVPLPRRPTIWRATADREWPRALMRQAGILQRARPANSPHLSEILILLIHALQDELPPPVPAGDPLERRVADLVDFVRRHPFPPPDTAALAAREGWSVSYLRAVFRKHTGESVGAWLRDLRLTEARRLLRETTRPIKEIGPLAGYSDQVSFHHAFVQHTGTTPARYRSNAPAIV